MDIVNIESLIANKRIALSADIDPSNDYVLIGKYQANNRKSGSGNANVYKSYAVPLAELLGSGGTYFGDETTIHLGAGNIFSFVSMNISQFTNNSGYITNSAISISPNVIPKGTGTGITNGTWSNVGTDIFPNTTGNIGTGSNRINTLFMSSVIDYATDLDIKTGSSTSMRVSASGNVGINTTTPTARLHIKGTDTLSTSYGLRIEDGATTSLFYVSNVGITTVRGSSGEGELHITSAGGIEPLLSFDYETFGSGTQGTIKGFNGLEIKGSGVTTLQVGPNGVGIGSSLLPLTDTRLHVKGINATGANFAARIESSTSNLYKVANNGQHNFNSYFDGGSGVPNYQFESNSGLLIKLKSTGAAIVWEEGGTTGAFSNAGGFAQMLFTNRFTLKDFGGISKLWMDNANGFIGIGSNYFAAAYQLDVDGNVHVQNGTIGVGVAPSGFYSVRANTTIRTETGNIETVANGSGVLWNGSGFSRIISDSSFNFLGEFANYYFGDSNGVNDLAITYSATKAQLGVGILIPTAKTHIVGLNSAATDFALKIDSSTLPQLHIRNDNRISIPSVQTGNASLVTGDIYVDTAANVLANGDLVVARKV